MVEIEAPVKWNLKIGESILVDGICSTVIKKGKSFLVEYMPETLLKSNIKKRNCGDVVNLERSLKLNDLLSGHLVTGHVDTTGVIKKIDCEENSKLIEISFKGNFGKYLVDKGSVTINGVSLTVIKSKKNSFTVSLIPYTLSKTNLGKMVEADSVNLEFDIISKYLERLAK